MSVTGPDGALYFITSNSGTAYATRDDDRLVRFVLKN